LQDKTIERINEWLVMLGESLKAIAGKELKQIIEQTQKYNKELAADMNSIDLLKILLKVISEIKDISMDMEFRIIEVQEQYRVLKMYNYEIEEETQKEVDNLMTNWEDLIDYADRRNFEVDDFKQTYSTVTKEEVKSFQQKIKEEYEKYLAKGPGTSGISLDEGVELLKDSKEKVVQFNKTREDNVSAEKLFNLEISKYPELIAMEEANKKYDEIYNVFTGLRINLLKNICSNFNEEGFKIAGIPIGKNIGEFFVGKSSSLENVIGFTDELHIAVLDAIVNHLHEVTSTTLPDVNHARFAVDFCGDAFENWFHHFPSRSGTARHNRRTFERPFFDT